MVRVIDYSLNDHLIVEKTLIRLSNSRCHAMLSHDAFLIYSRFEFRHIIRNLTYLHSTFISYLNVFLWITWLDNHTCIQRKGIFRLNFNANFPLGCINFIITYYLYAKQDIMKLKNVKYFEEHIFISHIQLDPS